MKSSSLWESVVLGLRNNPLPDVYNSARLDRPTECHSPFLIIRFPFPFKWSRFRQTRFTFSDPKRHTYVPLIPYRVGSGRRRTGSLIPYPGAGPLLPRGPNLVHTRLPGGPPPTTHRGAVIRLRSVSSLPERSSRSLTGTPTWSVPKL